MPERHQALMKTRCGECGTIFRVTPEQLRLKSGKVRCGQCQSIFNAFDTLINDDAEDAQEIAPEPSPLAEPEPVVELEPAPEQQALAPLEHLESIEESTTAARQAGLVAARDLTEISSYNRWSEGTLAGSSLGAFGEDSPRAAGWPYVLVALPLLFILLGQLIFHFRTELLLREPAFAPIFQSLAVNVPFPRNSELVTIEASDLQSDNARGLLLLQATLRNRASYDQAWPALELSLTDTQDAVIARRVLSVDDYRTPDNKSPVFPAQAEQRLHLTIDAKEIGAAGYRLYLFYP